jgi:hypothetical protein
MDVCRTVRQTLDLPVVITFNNLEHEPDHSGGERDEKDGTRI